MPPKKGTKAYKKPDPIKKNEVLTDSMKKKWILGPVIGTGGFGDIYTAAEGDQPPKKDSLYQYVVKIEPHENGPLFVERNFYLRVAKKDDVEAWVSKKKLKTFGMPVMHGSGTHEYSGIKYRFLVMDRFAGDLWQRFLDSNRVFPLSTVLRVCIQILDVLEYIHSKDYVHADIKGANLLLGLKKGAENQVYVVDFGLASRFNTGDFKRDPKKAHNGTIEYTSRDAHAGVPTRRGDLEILAYNMVQWLTSKLPWETILKDQVKVEEAKNKALSNIPEFLNKCFGSKPVPGVVSAFVTYVGSMKHNDKPDYAKLRTMLSDGLKNCGGKIDGPLDFSEEQENVQKKAGSRKSPRKVVKSKSVAEDDSPVPPKRSTSSKKVVTISSSDDESDPPPRSKKTTKKSEPSWRDCPTILSTMNLLNGVEGTAGEEKSSKRRKKM